MDIDIITLFPKMFTSVFGESMLKRAIAKKAINVNIHNLRDWTEDKHRTADDKPFGGGSGMVMKIEPVWKALRDIVKEPSGKGQGARKKKQKIILLTPQGKRLDQSIVKRLAKEKQLVLVCGHYEGVDERIRRLVDEEISIGDYILTCGELPAMVLVDAVARLKPGVLGNSESAGSESFEGGLLEYPQYTRPAEFAGMRVPEVLISGDHRKIDAWRKAESVKRTIERRPDLVGSRVRGKGLYKKEMRNE